MTQSKQYTSRYLAPDRVDFDPFPYQSMAVWILTQMKRWGYIKGDVDYQFQGDAAYDDVATLYGVYGVTNEIKVNAV